MLRVFLSSVLFVIFPALASAQGWYNGAWTYRKAITISSSQNSGGSNLTNFPLLISVTDSNLAAAAQSSGDDILFTASDGVTKLSHEIETYTSSIGLLNAWVCVPSISPTTNTVIYMYYGNSSASSQQNPTGAWDSNFMGVWHLPNGSTLSANDSTGHGNNGSISGAGAVGGEIGGAASFNGSSSVISIGGASSVQITGQITMSGWVNVPVFPPPDANGNCCWSYIIGKGYDGSNEGFFLRLNDQNGPMLLEAGSYQYPTNNTVGWTISGWNTNSWHYVVGSYDGSAWHVYLDGVLEDSSNQTTGAVASGAGVSLGGTLINGTLTRFWNGDLDEVRLSNIARSPAWIAAEYHNQSSPSTFFSIGGQETSSSGSLGGTSVSPNSGTGFSQTFTATYNDPAGASDIQNLVINIGGSSSSANSCSVLFARATSEFQLATNSGSWGSPISPGASASNSQCTLNTASSIYSFSGNTGTITVNLTFTSAFAGTQGIWLYVSTNSGSNAGGSQLGSWTVAAAEGITVTSSPPGLVLSVDGSNCTAPCSESWIAGSNHTIAVATSPQAGSTGTQYLYSNWSDGGTQSHSITVPSSAATYTANFSTQYYLTTAASPSAGGSISPGSGWYNSGTGVSISAGANSGYTFPGFSGALTGTTTPQTLTMNGPESVTAVFSSVNGPAWYNGAWPYRKAITIASGQVSGPSNLTNFPMLFSVTDANLGSAAQATGNDILFTASDGVTKLNHEIESYISSNGTLVAWVQVPTLSYSVNTVLYMYYGNGSAASQQNPAGSWDSNFVGVYHFPSGSTLTANDSTGNTNNGSINNATGTTGIAGGGASFNGSSSTIDMGSSSTFDDSTLTYEAWVKPSPISGPSVTFISQGTQGPTFRVKAAGNIYSSDECVVDNNLSTAAVTFNAWNFVAMTWNSSTGAYQYFVNGQPAGGGTTPETFVWNTFRVGDAHCYPEYYGGVMDEIRMSNTARSAGWIATEYANISAPLSFSVVGGQQSSNGETQVAPPTFSPSGGTFTSAQSVSITTTTSGASIYYTTDGSTPSQTNGTLYSSPVPIGSSSTLQAIAYASGMTPSPVTSATYTISMTVSSIVNTSPAGLPIVVDGTTYTAPQTFGWVVGSSHTIAISSATQPGATGVQYAWANWSDLGGQSHTIVGPASAATYTANFTTQYYLVTTTQGSYIPTETIGGAIFPVSGWYNANSAIQVSAVATPANPFQSAPGFVFTGFTGSAGIYSTTTPYIFTISQPTTVTANFAIAPLVVTSPTTLPSGTVGVRYLQQITAAGGLPPYSLTFLANSQTYGFTLAGGTSIQSNPPPTAGTYTLNLIVSDFRGTTVPFVPTVTINNNSSQPTVTCTAYPASVAPGQSVTFTAAPSGGNPGYTYTWGQVATGLGATQSVSYRTSSTGVFIASVTVTDSAGGTGSGTCQVTVQPASTTPATMLSPAPNSTLTGSSVTFQWSTGTGVSQYGLTIGSALGGSDIYNNPDTELVPYATVTQLPVNGQTLYVTLFSLISGEWITQQYTYAAANGTATPLPIAASPTNQTVAPTMPATFLVTVGSSAGFSGTVGFTVSGVPAGVTASLNPPTLNGSGTTTLTITPSASAPMGMYSVRIFASSGSTSFGTMVFPTVSPASPANMLTPGSGTNLPSGITTFTWDAGFGATQYQLSVGSTPGGSDILQPSGAAPAQSATVNLQAPNQPSTIYATLSTLISGQWQSRSYTYGVGTPATPTGASGSNVTPQSSSFALLNDGSTQKFSYCIVNPPTLSSAADINSDSLQFSAVQPYDDSNVVLSVTGFTTPSKIGGTLCGTNLDSFDITVQGGSFTRPGAYNLTLNISTSPTTQTTLTAANALNVYDATPVIKGVLSYPPNPDGTFYAAIFGTNFGRFNPGTVTVCVHDPNPADPCTVASGLVPTNQFHNFNSAAPIYSTWGTGQNPNPQLLFSQADTQVNVLLTPSSTASGPYDLLINSNGEGLGGFVSYTMDVPPTQSQSLRDSEDEVETPQPTVTMITLNSMTWGVAAGGGILQMTKTNPNWQQDLLVNEGTNPTSLTWNATGCNPAACDPVGFLAGSTPVIASVGITLTPAVTTSAVLRIASSQNPGFTFSNTAVSVVNGVVQIPSTGFLVGSQSALPTSIGNPTPTLTWSISFDGGNSWTQFAQSTHNMFVVLGAPTGFAGTTVTIDGVVSDPFEAAPSITAKRVYYAVQQAKTAGSAAVAVPFILSGISAKFGFDLHNTFSGSNPIPIPNPWAVLDNASLVGEDGTVGWDCLSLNELAIVQAGMVGLGPMIQFAWSITAPNNNATMPQTQGALPPPNSNQPSQYLEFFPGGGTDPNNPPPLTNKNTFETYFTVTDSSNGLSAFMAVPTITILPAADPIANNPYVSGLPVSQRISFAVIFYEHLCDSSTQWWYMPSNLSLQGPIAFPIAVVPPNNQTLQEVCAIP
jgi:hypothetical protein